MDNAIVTPPTPGQDVADRYRGVHFFDAAASVSRTMTVRAPRALRIARATPCGEPVSPDVAEFLTWLLPLAGLDPGIYRQQPLVRRIAACLRSLRCRSLDEARTLLDRDPEQISTAINALLIGVTQFFRDRAVFSYLEDTLVPPLKGHRSRLRIWSAGCADGSELYSVAMILARRGLLEQSRLLGSDCRADAVYRASQGFFHPSQLNGLDPLWRADFFVRHGAQWRVCETLRQAAYWRQAGLLGEAPAEQAEWDLILCRNVAIYLQPEAVELLWSALVQALRPGGVLIVGKAERPSGRLPLLRLAPCVFQKRG
jgi:chemotaxis protein methyltransferase CheR